MKRRLIFLLAAALLPLLVAPATNLLRAPDIRAVQWKQKVLYNMDFALRGLSRLLYPLGVSVDPAEAVIGREGWLFLGDQYEATRTTDRLPPSKADAALAKHSCAAVEALEDYLKSHGVRLFRVIVAPNKDAIYPEHMPEWAKPVSPSLTDLCFAACRQPVYIDLRAGLAAAKPRDGFPLYYKTDSHWNALGAVTAFRIVAASIARDAPDLRWPDEATYAMTGSGDMIVGDMARFLRLQGLLPDPMPGLPAQKLGLETEQYDFDTMLLVRKGGNPTVDSVDKPLLVKSPGALNDRKVLWLRDSSGTSMAPLMAATFSQVMQLHWSAALGENGPLPRLVEGWRPDYVFVSIAERLFKRGGLAPAQKPLTQPWPEDFQPLVVARPVSLSQLVKDDGGPTYRIDGTDAHVDYALPALVQAKDMRYLSVDLTCEDGSPDVPMQIFWLRDEDSGYAEARSVRFTFPTGQRLVDLRNVPGWDKAGEVRGIRIDIDAVNHCRRFTLREPGLAGQADQ